MQETPTCPPPSYSRRPRKGERTISRCYDDSDIDDTINQACLRGSVLPVTSDERNDPMLLFTSDEEQTERQKAINSLKDVSDSDSSFVETLFGSPKTMAAIYERVTSALMLYGEVSILQIKIEVIWEYSICTVLSSNDVTKEADFYSDLIQHTVYDRTILAGKRNAKSKIAKSSAKVSLRNKQHNSSKAYRIKYSSKNNSERIGKFFNIDKYHHGKLKSAFPEDILLAQKGICVYEKPPSAGSLSSPITAKEFALDQSMVKASASYWRKHKERADFSSHILNQTQHISAIPVYDIIYEKCGEINSLYVIGNDHVVHFP